MGNDYRKGGAAGARLMIRLSEAEQGLFAERLALLLGASLSLPEAVAVMRGAFGRRRMAAMSRLENTLESGSSFESALSDSSLGFKRALVIAARVGERSGTLGASLSAAAEGIERRRVLRQSVLSALLYPGIIFGASVGIISFLVFFIMPRIMPTIESLHVPLPPVTKFFIFASHFLVAEWWQLLLAAAVASTALVFCYKKIARFRLFTHRAVMATPVVSSAVKAHVLSGLFDMMATLASGGCPFIEAVSESSASFTLIPYRQALSEAAGKMKSGRSFSSVLAEHPRLFPALVAESLAIGERTGNMEAMLSRMSGYYARELQSSLAGFSRLIEPVLMIAVGIVVGAAALSIVMPVYEISQHVSK